MSANAPSNNAPRLLKELKIPGRTGPVTQTPLTWGINLAALKLNFPRQGLLCQAGPWGTMDIGDSLRIWRGSDQLIGLEIVDKDEVNTELQIFVQAKHFPDGMHKISYAVTRLGGTPEHSEVMQVLVKTTLPGGPDHSETPGHPALVMSIPKEILEGGINMENVKNGIPVTLGKGDGTPPYPFASAGDKLQFTCGGIFYEAPELTEEQANGTTPLVVTIPEVTIRKAGDSDATGMAIAFEVYDPVHNRSEDWSIEQRVVVTLDTTLLVAPLLKEAINNELDVDKLAGAAGTAQVWISGNSFKVGDRPVLRIRGTPREGQPIDLEVRGEVLVSVPSTHETNIPNAVLRQLVQTQIALSYRLEKADGSTELKSKTQFISAIGEIHRLAAPVALDAEQGAIDPLDPDLKQVRIEIPFDASFLPGQAIKLFWLGTRPDLSTYLPTLPLRLISQGDYEAKDPLLIIVDIQHLTAIIGGKLELYYQLLIDDSVLGTMTQLSQIHAIRESIHADILQIGEPRKELPEPQVDGVVDGMLPPDTNGTTLTVNYLKTSVGDIVTRFWRGSNTGVNSDWVKLSSFTAGQPVPFQIKAELIKDNEGGTAEADYQIEWAAGGTSYSDTLKFNVGVKPDLKDPEIKEAVNNVLQPFAAKDTLTAIVRAFPNMVGTQVSVTWAGTPGEGTKTVGPITVTAQQDLEVSLDNLLVAFNLGNDGVKVTYVVTRNGTPEGSKELALQVAVIIDGDSNLPTPTINGAVGNELDVTQLAEDAQLRIAKWMLQALGQCIWLRFDGTDKNGNAVEKVFWAGEAHQQAEGLVTAAQVAWLRELKDGSPLTVTFKVNYDKVANFDTAVEFPLRTYTVKVAQAVRPTITSIKGLPSGIEIPGRNRFTLETAVKLSGYATKGSKVQIFSGTSLGQVSANATTGYWEKSVTGLNTATTYGFWVKDLHNGLRSDSAGVRPIELSLSEDFRSDNYEVKPKGVPYHELRSGQLTWISGSGSVRVATSSVTISPLDKSRLMIFDNSIVDYQFRSTYSSLSFWIAGKSAVECNLTTYDKSGKTLETKVFRSEPYRATAIKFSTPTIFRLRIEGALSAQQLELDNFQFTL